MNTGDRIKFLRIGDGLTQRYIAELLGVRQKSVALMESGKSKVSLRATNILSNYFIVSKEWLENGTPPVILDGWGYVSVPFKGWKELPASEKPKRLNQIADAMGTLFVDFLVESTIKKFFKAEIGGSEDVILVFPASSKSSLLLRVAGDLWPMLEGILKDTGLRPAKSIMIAEEMANSIHQSSSPLSKLEHTIELHRLLGLGQLTRGWSVLERTRDQRCVKVYQNRVNKVCRDILEKGIDPADVVNTIKEMTTARLNYQFKDSVDFLLSRAKAPLFKRHAEKIDDADNSDR